MPFNVPDAGTGFSSALHLPASVRSWNPWMPCSTPWLARVHANASTPQERATTEDTFEAFHRFLGVGVGEHLGYLLTGLWTGLIGIAIANADVVPDWLGWIGVVIGLGLVVGSTEFLGSNEEHGWKNVGNTAANYFIIAIGMARRG